MLHQMVIINQFVNGREKLAECQRAYRYNKYTERKMKDVKNVSNIGNKDIHLSGYYYISNLYMYMDFFTFYEIRPFLLYLDKKISCICYDRGDILR